MSIALIISRYIAYFVYRALFRFRATALHYIYYWISEKEEVHNFVSTGKTDDLVYQRSNMPNAFILILMERSKLIT